MCEYIKKMIKVRVDEMGENDLKFLKRIYISLEEYAKEKANDREE